MRELEAQWQSLPTTTVAFLSDNLVAAGNGSMLSVYDILTQQVVHREQIFVHTRIHGIVAKPSAEDIVQILVFGGKSWTTFEINTSNRELISTNSRTYEVCDWIKAGHWVRAKGSWKVVLATAHNCILVMSLETGTCERKVAGAEQCVLYAAALWGDSIDDLVVAAGTVFNIVLVWRLNEPNLALWRLQGHEGAVFGVSFCRNGKALTSVSDDRSVRVWDLETGRVERVLYGHRARVWKCVAVDESASWLISCSEDGTCREWQDGNTVDVRPQTSKNVWAVDVRAGMVASAGGDGSLWLWRAGMSRRIESIDELQPVQLPSCNPYAVESASHSPETIRGFALVDAQMVVVVTKSGRLLAHDLVQRTWREVDGACGLQGYAMVAAEPTESSLVAIGCRNGVVAVLRGTCAWATARLHKACVQWLCVSRRIGNLCDIVSVDDSGDIVWSTVSDNSWRIVARLQRASPGTRVSAAAVSSDGQWVALGSARGSLYIYSAQNCALFNKPPMLPVACVWPQAHGSYSVSTLLFDSNSSGTVLHSGGRDGWRRTFCIGEPPADASAAYIRRGDNANASLYRVSAASVTPGWVERLYEYCGQLLAVTFFCKRLALADMASGSVLFSCVGADGSRQWQLLFASSCLRLAFVSRNQLLTTQFDVEQLLNTRAQALATGISSTDLRCVQLLQSSQCLVALVGGEDGYLRVVECKAAASRVLAAAKRHRSAIRCIQMLPPSFAGFENSRFVLTAGAGSEMRCWKLDMGESNTLSKTVLAEWCSVLLSRDTDMRIMDIRVVCCRGSVAYIVAACSDASVALWRMDAAKQQFACVSCSAAAPTCCVLSIESVQLSDGRIVVLAGTTDGSIYVWELPDADALASTTVELDAQMRLLVPHVHQSGVNTLCVRTQSSGVVVASGGDDCSISLTSIDTQSSQRPTARLVCRRKLAHASAVQGLSFVDANRLCSVATDQRVALWKGEDLELLQMQVTQVADPSAINVHYDSKCSRWQVAVAGMGLQVFRL
ncbi:WD repeat-containing protein 6 [Coemansia sp. RSA 2336]|nr:WD repeat-containing protein 6 [Coemansia sp. RSA 2336]